MEEETLARPGAQRQPFAKRSMLVLLIYNSIALLAQQNTWEGSETLPLSVFYERGLKCGEPHWKNHRVIPFNDLPQRYTQADIRESGINNKMIHLYATVFS